MRNRLVTVATSGMFVLAFCSTTWAQGQGQTERPAKPQTGNPTAGQQGASRPGEGQQGASKTTEMETIRGVVAAIATEGEAVFDYRTNRAAAAQAAFLTVVGSPKNSEGHARDTAAGASDKSGSTMKKRHNVYHVWLTARTKICEAGSTSEKTSQTQAQAGNQNQGRKNEVTFDQLEVGDHVEIQFTRRDDSEANSFGHQTEQMRRSHGRQRTFVGQASEVTILDSDEASHNWGAGSRENPNPGSR